ncbi:hypothetical protein PIB30_078173 [Stylosanthes scabra]|uniref:Uncharacterized protein n=1 Tax=Stylosanthes scabra TaxID=79078 RepID=A0ABU6UTD4_9FABA|nr:hypothetical protein [Stylosanthes scabra]
MPQHTSYVGHSSIATQFDRGCTLYVTASRQTWLHLSKEKASHVVRDSFTYDANSKDSNLNLQRPVHMKRKGKAIASSSQVPKFKTPYHEAHYKAKLSPRKVLPELIIQVDESILDPCGFEIQQKKWERFTNPIQAVGHLMVKEFYANTWEPDKEKRKPYTYTTMVRGKDISIVPSNIKRVLKLRKDPLPNAASYHERKANKDYKL